MKKLKNCGFTIIELLMVVIIIGLLVTIATPSYLHSLERAKCSTALSTLKSMRTGALDWFREQQTFVGADRDTVSAQVGGNFDDNNEWTYMAGGNATTWTATATRVLGPHTAGTITINELDRWNPVGTDTYPVANP